ncbi:MAG: serine hydrolase [Cyclobacteriaceae bacterium]
MTRSHLSKIDLFFIRSLFLCALLSCSSEDGLSPSGLQETIQAEMASLGIKGLAIATIDGNRIDIIDGFGFQNTISQIPLNENSLFVSLSIAKLVVATAVMQQVEAGLIDLDEDISTYLEYEFRNPNFVDVPITARLLMTHQSSLANPDVGGEEDPNFDFSFVIPETRIDMESWVSSFLIPGGEMYNPKLWKNYNPGSSAPHLSSNMGISILAHLVEKVANMTFGEYTRTNIFEPLEMENTGYDWNQSPGSLDNSLFVEHFTSLGTPHPTNFGSKHYAAVLLRTSVKDWANFLLCILNRGQFKGRAILDENSVNMMLDIKFPEADLPFNAGIGLVWRSYGTWLGHTSGGLTSASSVVNPETGDGFIVISNGRGESASTVYPGGNIYKALVNHLER